MRTLFDPLAENALLKTVSPLLSFTVSVMFVLLGRVTVNVVFPAKVVVKLLLKLAPVLPVLLKLKFALGACTVTLRVAVAVLPAELVTEYISV